MLGYILPIVGMFLSVFLIVQREMIGDILGEPNWAKAIGGIYSVVVYLALIIFLWSLAELTGSTRVMFHFLTYIIAGQNVKLDF
jgi:hypothetical protein